MYITLMIVLFAVNLFSMLHSLKIGKNATACFAAYALGALTFSVIYNVSH